MCVTLRKVRSIFIIAVRHIEKHTHGFIIVNYREFLTPLRRARHAALPLLYCGRYTRCLRCLEEALFAGLATWRKPYPALHWCNGGAGGM